MQLKIPSELFFYINPNDGKEKITLGPTEDGKHITLHFGTKSGVFDIHTKDEKNNIYETLIQIDHASLIEAYSKSIKQIEALIRKAFSKYITVGKLERYSCILYPMSLNGDVEKIIQIKKNKVRLRKSVNLKDIEKLMAWPDELQNFPSCESFFVYRIHKGSLCKNGVIFKIPNPSMSKTYIFLSQKNLNKLFKELSNLLLQGLNIQTRDAIKRVLKI